MATLARPGKSLHLGTRNELITWGPASEDGSAVGTRKTLMVDQCFWPDPQAPQMVSVWVAIARGITSQNGNYCPPEKITTFGSPK